MPRSTSIIHGVREGDGSTVSAGKTLPDGVSRSAALRELLEKHEEPPSAAHAYWDKQRVRPCPNAVVQEAAARRVWPSFLRRLGLAVVLVTCATFAHAQERTTTVKPATQSITSSGPRLTPQQAADVLRPNQYVAPPTCERCDGPYIIVLNSTPGAAYWMPFPPEAPRRRLDGTLIDSRPPDSFWSAPVLRHRR
jgi:hypothetical protein